MEKITFGDSIEKPVKITEGIFLDGVQIGEMNRADGERRCRFHCVLQFGGTLMQGHGDGKSEAFKNALFAGRLEAERLLCAVNELDRKIGGAA